MAGRLTSRLPLTLIIFTGWVAEPWNTASACLFVIISVAWLFALRGRYRQHPFLTMCLPILATGGVGGVLFHGLRQYRAFFLMDVIPIYLLGMVVSVWLWVRLGPRLLHLIGMIVFLGILQLLGHFQLPVHWAINLSYACLAILVILPLALALVRTRFRHGGWVYTAFVCFAIAWTCRGIDPKRLLPMGTHWLWHVFGAATTASLSVHLPDRECFVEESEPFTRTRSRKERRVTGGSAPKRILEFIVVAGDCGKFRRLLDCRLRCR